MWMLSYMRFNAEAQKNAPPMWGDRILLLRRLVIPPKKTGTDDATEAMACDSYRLW